MHICKARHKETQKSQQIPRTMAGPKDLDDDPTASKLRRQQAAHDRRIQKKKSRLFSEENLSDTTVSAKEWIVPNLRHWVLGTPSHSTSFYKLVESSPVRTLPLSLRAGVQSSSNDARSTRYPLHRALTPEPAIQPSRHTNSSSPHYKTEEYLQRLGAIGVKRFYRTDPVKNKLTGPENYFLWAEELQTKLTQCHAWPLVEGEMTPVPMQSPFHTRWMQMNNKAWLLIITNVCREIRRDLCTSWAWDTRGSWSYLHEKYGDATATLARSVQGVQDLTSLRLDDCASVGEFLGKIKECIRAIECHRPGKEGDEWLWCQFILAKLGALWESWTSVYLMKMRGGYGSGRTMGRIDQLLVDIEAEEARRVRALRFSSLHVY